MIYLSVQFSSRAALSGCKGAASRTPTSRAAEPLANYSPLRGDPPGLCRLSPSPEGAPGKSLEHVESKLDAGKPQVAQKIGTIDVFDVKVVVIAPAIRPTLIVTKRIAAILEAVIPTPHLGMAHVERVAVTEMGTVIGVRNAAIIAPTSAATVASDGLCPLPGGLLRLCALRLHFLCALLRLCFLCPLLWLCLLCPLLWLCFLCALLRLRFLCVLLRLCFLCVLRLLLVLCWLSFLSASALFFLNFLGECRNGGSEKQKEDCCADNSIVFHRCCLQTHVTSASHRIREAPLLYRLRAWVSVHYGSRVRSRMLIALRRGENYSLAGVGNCRGFQRDGASLTAKLGDSTCAANYS